MTHKLTFRKIRAKNFRSIQNSWMEFDYQSHKATLVASTDNGSGKSTMLIFSLYYALFGKSYQKGSKIGSLINSRSNKDSIVEVEFCTKGSEWKVVRGQKPTVMEIWQDGVMHTNEASLKDPQGFLEALLGFDEKAFNSVIALGVNRFVPFVDFTAAERRVFVEGMLDLIIISEMATNTKDKIKAIKKQIDQLFYETGTMESKLTGRQRTIQILKDKKAQRLVESGTELNSFSEEQTKVTSLLLMSNKKIDELNTSIEIGVEEKQSSTKAMLDRFKYKDEGIKRAAGSVIHLEDCPTCQQSVTEAHKTAIQADADKESSALVTPIEKLTSDLVDIAKSVSKNVLIRNSINDVRIMQAKLESRLKSAGDSILSIQAKLVDSNEDSLIQIEQTEIDVISVQLETKTTEMNDFKKQESEHTQFLGILADDGVKASIVQQYLPFLVSDINNTLDKLNLFININIDNDFNMTMMSPNRKGQTIENLSTGQQRRVDLAVLLSWRNIAKKKASVDTNILILDEVLESLSATGVSEFMDFWRETADDVNIFVVTQRNDEFESYFDRSVLYALKDDATVIVGE